MAVSAAFALAAAGCSLPPRAPPSAPSPAPRASTAPSPPFAAVDDAQADRLGIDPAQSELRLLVFRAGTLARLGHDHVIESHALSGWIDPRAVGARQLVDLVIPVDTLEIDPDAARAEEGPAFAEPITAEAKAGTRHNMLGEALLDAAHFPRIEVRGLAADAAESTTAPSDGTPRAATVPATVAATLAVAVAGHESRQTVELNIARDADRLTLSADFSLRQTALGLAPFSVMMGALQVKDEMRVHVHLVALRIHSSD